MTKIRLLPTLLLIFVLGCRAFSADQTPITTQVLPTPLPSATLKETTIEPVRLGSTQRDVVYCSIRNSDLLMDLYYPPQGVAPFPVVVFVHGGGWSEGSKADWVGHIGARELAERGYVLASVDYRLAPGFRFPSMIEDVKCAVRSLRAHAGEWGIDPNRIGAMGASAGGHLVALLGTADETAGWDSGEGFDTSYDDFSSKVMAVVDLYGPAELHELFSTSNQNLAQSVFGVRSVSEEPLVVASPNTYISPDDPPFLILHGDQDSTVSIEQSEGLHADLVSGGVDAELVIVQGAGHGFPRSGSVYSPTFDELEIMIADFFDENLN